MSETHAQPLWMFLAPPDLSPLEAFDIAKWSKHVRGRWWLTHAHPKLMLLCGPRVAWASAAHEYPTNYDTDDEVRLRVCRECFGRDVGDEPTLESQVVDAMGGRG